MHGSGESEISLALRGRVAHARSRFTGPKITLDPDRLSHRQQAAVVVEGIDVHASKQDDAHPAKISKAYDA